MKILMGVLQLVYLIVALIKKYFWEFSVIILIFFIYKYRKNYKSSKTFLQSKTGFIILDGKFETGKTRFMTDLAKDSDKTGRFVLGNFYNGYNFIKWNSLEDLKNLLYDVWLLGEYQNFSDEELKTLYMQDGLKVYKEKKKQRVYLKRKYKNIPYNGFHNNFLILGDEFQNYMFNRGAMSNFSGDNKNLLKLFHQVRHFNSLLVLGTQESDELDVKFRRLSTFYINTGEKIGGIIFYYNVYQFLTDKENNLNLEKAKKFTKVPVFKINYYMVNEIVKKIEYRLNSLNHKHEKLNNFFHYEIFKPRRIKHRFNELQFHTKYNVNPDISTYKSEDLFKKLNEFYENKDNYYLTKLN